MMDYQTSVERESWERHINFRRGKAHWIARADTTECLSTTRAVVDEQTITIPERAPPYCRRHAMADTCADFPVKKLLKHTRLQLLSKRVLTTPTSNAFACRIDTRIINFSAETSTPALMIH
eukprot:4776762-Pyramimonas_sp.AAC.1